MMRDALALAVASVVLGACDASQPWSDLDSHTAAIISGEDDRMDYFELQDESPRRAADYTVAMVRAFDADKLLQRRVANIPTWGELDRLCSEERFESQPSAAFCSGVLVEADLVLTARHCVDLIALAEIRVVLDYYLAGPDDLAVGEHDVYEIAEVVTAQGPTPEEKLDVAWLRLSRSVVPARSAVMLREQGSALGVGDSILVVGAAGGTPLKWDLGGRVSELRAEQDDYFVATTDTFKGSSGGPALGADMNLVGILGRGSSDFERSDAGCRTAIRRDTTQGGGSEQFIYAHRAVAALCQHAPDRAVCATGCGERCQAEMERAARATVLSSTAGCSAKPGTDVRGFQGALGCVALLLALSRRRPSMR